MRPRFLILLLLMNLAWAATYVVFKGLSPCLTAGQIVTWRYTLAAAMLAAAWPWLPGTAPQGWDLVKTCLMGLAVFFLGSRLQVLGVHWGRAADASVLIALEPLVTSLAAAMFLGERLPGRRWVGLVLGMAGVVLLARVWRTDFQWPSLGANLLIIASYVCDAPWSVMGKILIQRASLLKVVTVAVLAGAAGNLAWDGWGTFQTAGQLSLWTWLLLLYLAAVCTVVGFSFWYVVIRETEVNVTALTVFMQPVAGLLLSIACLGEPWHWGQLWGSLAIVAALLVGLPGRTKSVKER